jgi:signal transduction histidine kinase
MYRALPSLQRTRCVTVRDDYSIARGRRSSARAPLDIADWERVGDAQRHEDEQTQQGRKMELVGRLTAGVSHDLNNLLSVVSSNLDLIEHVANNGKIGRFAAAARRAIDLSASLTSQLLTFSRYQRMRPILVDASQLISEFQELLRQALGARFDLKLQTDRKLWRCHVDPLLLKTALLNLVLNGRDAMPGGGTIELETRNVIMYARCADGCQSRSYVRVSVTDTGKGIPAEVRERVFEPFFTTKEVGKGTGLGLSMVREFVRLAGGHVEIDSTSAGTTVALYLPRTAEGPEA